MLYTTFLATKLKEGEEKSVQLYARAIEDLTKASDVTNDISLQLTQDFKIPAILTDNKDNIITAVNFSDELNEDTLFLKDQLKEIKSNGYKPIDIKDEFVNQKVYYKNSRLYTYLTYFPYIQLLPSLAWDIWASRLLENQSKTDCGSVWLKKQRINLALLFQLSSHG